MEDIAPDLINAVLKEFKKEMRGDKELIDTLNAINGGSRSYTDAMDFSDCVGRAMENAVRNTITADQLPDGTLYYNIAKRIMDEAGGSEYDLAQDAAMQVQKQINEDAGIGMNAVEPGTKDDRIDGIVNTVSGKPYDDVSEILITAVRELPQGAVSDTLKANMDFQEKSGLNTKIIRKAEFRACDWCRALAGTYDYEQVKETGNDVFRRHKNCRCTVEYYPGKGRKKQDVWTKEWKSVALSDKIKTRISEEKKDSRGFKTQELLNQHFEKHAQEYGAISVQQYLRQARGLADAETSEDVVQLVRSDNSISRYRYSTNDFIVVNEDGSIRTFFKPVDKEAYWNDELERN